MKNENFKNLMPEDFFDSGDLKVLICYLMASVKEPIPSTETSQLFHYEGIANYFDTQTAISDLQKGGYIEPTDESQSLYKITQKGVSLSQTLKENVSIAIRTKIYNAVIKMLSRYKNEKETDIKIEKSGAGFLLTCTVNNSGEVLFSFSLLLPNESQALALKEQILKDPSYYYDSFINILTADIPLDKA